MDLAENSEIKHLIKAYGNVHTTSLLIMIFIISQYLCILEQRVEP